MIDSLGTRWWIEPSTTYDGPVLYHDDDVAYPNLLDVLALARRGGYV